MQMIWPSSDPLRLPLKAHTLNEFKVQITCFVYNLNSFEYCFGGGGLKREGGLLKNYSFKGGLNRAFTGFLCYTYEKQSKLQIV